jgi:hypothetical protein
LIEDDPQSLASPRRSDVRHTLTVEWSKFEPFGKLSLNEQRGTLIALLSVLLIGSKVVVARLLATLEDGGDEVVQLSISVLGIVDMRSTLDDVISLLVEVNLIVSDLPSRPCGA